MMIILIFGIATYLFFGFWIAFIVNYGKSDDEAYAAWFIGWLPLIAIKIVKGCVLSVVFLLSSFCKIVWKEIFPPKE